MIFNTKEEQDLHIRLMLKNVVRAEVAFSLKNRSRMHSYFEFVGVLQKELDGAIETLNDFNDELGKIWEMIKDDAPNPEIIERLRVAAYLAEEKLHKDVDVAAVINTVIEQLEKAPTDGNQ